MDRWTKKAYKDIDAALYNSNIYKNEELCNELKKYIKRWSKKIKEIERSQLLTGKELKFAAENKLKVRYVEQYYNPEDRDKEYDDICIMEKASSGYYIGNSDIDPDDFGDDEFVEEDFPEGTFAVYKALGIKYE